MGRKAAGQQAGGKTDRWAGRQACGQTGGQAGGGADGYVGIQVGRQASFEPAEGRLQKLVLLIIG